jgi:serine/threonine-protein kinase HipA
MAAKDLTHKILVYAHWEGLKEPSLMGVLSSIQTRGKEIFSFEYAEDWLSSGYAQRLDPDLELYSGLQYIREGKKSFDIFLDSAPDRWGRVLMQRRETDYLLGVFDEARMGALRFKEDASGPFLNNNKELAVPPWAFLRKLENASLELEQSNAVDTSEYFEWLNLLIAPGSSLGGARPKASVYDATNNLWIAKFPSRKDDKDVGGWEMVVHELAAGAGLFITDSVAMQ